MKEVKYTGQPYDVSASTEWGVPLKISPYIEGENWGRSTVEAVYQQIVSDLKDAVDHLSGLPARSYYWANVLSRVYCYMGKWDLVPELCDDVLEQNKYGLQDLVPMIANDSVNGWVGPASPEIIFTQGSYSLNTLTYDGANSSTTIASYQISSALKELFVDGDKRKDFLYRRSPSNDNVKYSQKIKQKKTEGNAVYLSDVFLLRLPEVYLNKAEALAMTGKEGDAREALRLLMEKRFMPDALPAITESGKGLIDLIRNERRREFCFEGQRWFDLRRYAVSPKYPDAKKNPPRRI